jgi:hypothetical protein
MNNIEIKHIHAGVTYFNGALYFVVDNRLLHIGVSTPNFNDYGEWRISGFNLSKLPYNPLDNKVELKPYENFKNIFINQADLDFLDLMSYDDGDSHTDEHVEKIKEALGDKFETYTDELAGGRFKYQKQISIIRSNDIIKMSVWRKIKNPPSFEKILYPILEGFRLGYINSRK